MFRCTGTNSSGDPCKNIVRTEKGTCCWHTPIRHTDPQCSVCLETMTTRNFRTLECGHTFHPKCLKKWKRQGNRTCPMCREAFDTPEFNVTITVEPLVGDRLTFDASSSSDRIFNRLDLDIDNLAQYSSTQLSFEADNLNNLRSVLSEIGVDLNGTDLYSLIRRDTE